jgi:hypothetical protein
MRKRLKTRSRKSSVDVDFIELGCDASREFRRQLAEHIAHGRDDTGYFEYLRTAFTGEILEAIDDTGVEDKREVVSDLLYGLLLGVEHGLYEARK